MAETEVKKKKKRTITVDPVVTLNETYSITLDPRCLILHKKTTPEDKDLSDEEKKEGSRVLGYFTSWEHLGKNLVEDLSKEKARATKQEKISMEDFIKMVQKSNKEVQAMFGKVDEYTKIKK